MGAVFAEAEASDNLLERRQFNLKLVKEFRIEDGTTGFGYDAIFSDGIDERLKSVIIDEPYLRNKSQVYLIKITSFTRNLNLDMFF